MSQTINSTLYSDMLRQGAASLYKDKTVVNDLNVFPNPATDRLNVSFVMPDESPVSCKILDMTGKLLYNKQIESNGGLIEESVDVSGFAKGIYFLRIETTKGTTIEKFVKE